ncbi:MAG TPA: hypothetical protein VJ717_05120 [Gemmatimonadaceae bacterium]|nr:hypothetical protein [Gemmatimonadaceae bacterium]
MRTSCRAVFVLSIAVFSTALGAQSQPNRNALPVPPGARVRVTAPSLVGPLVANYLEMRGDTVVLVEDRAGQGLWSIPYADIGSLHLSAGMKRNHTPYILQGAVLGGGAGFLIGILSAATFQPSDTSRKFKRVTTGLVGGAIGAGIGAFVGSRFSTENWVPISLPRRVSVYPSSKGAVVKFDVTF